jgi:hypothetical protein
VQDHRSRLRAGPSLYVRRQDQNFPAMLIVQVRLPGAISHQPLGLTFRSSCSEVHMSGVGIKKSEVHRVVNSKGDSAPAH